MDGVTILNEIEQRGEIFVVEEKPHKLFDEKVYQFRK